MLKAGTIILAIAILVPLLDAVPNWQCPPPVGFGTCDEQCRGDSDCQGPMKCCSNGCGHVCMKRVKGCRHKGTLLDSGSVVLEAKCTVCVCNDGEVTCTKVADKNYSPEGDPCVIYSCFGGKVETAIIDCIPPFLCPNPTYVEGQCCPNCNPL